eukprot:360243-Chlamydomonas_euryale.AAC.3
MPVACPSKAALGTLCPQALHTRLIREKVWQTTSQTRLDAATAVTRRLQHEFAHHTPAHIVA